MKNKAFETILIYLLFGLVLSACAGYYSPPPQIMSVAPADGEVYNLFSGTANWLATKGDVLVKSYFNSSTNVMVHARPLMDGYAVACENVKCPNSLVGYFSNVRTWNDLKQFLMSTGFVQIAREAVPFLRMPTIIVMPVFVSANANDDGVIHAWEVTNFCLPGRCGIDEAGNKYPVIEGLSELDGEWITIGE